MRSALLLVSIAASLAGCVVAPHDNQVFASRTTPIYFQGYAENPASSLDIECRVGSTWTHVATTTATSSAANPGQPTPLYQFSTSVALPGSCWTIPFENEYQATVRVREPGSSTTALQTFTADGITCLGNEFASSTDWVAMGFGCKGTQGVEMRVRAHS